MKFKLSDILVDSEKEGTDKLVKQVRVVLMAGIFMYSVFGILDWFVLPETYFTAWIFRFCVVVPMSLIFFLLTYSKKYQRYGRMWLTAIAIIAQIGIALMIYNAKPSEGGYWGYFAGLIIVNLWAVLMLRLSLAEVIVISSLNVIFYNIVALGFQHLNRYPSDSYEFGYLLSNNFFLVSSSFLAIVGAFQLNSYKKKIFEHNQLLNLEKIELYKSKKKAEESDRLKSAFLANMSHEIRTPMNAILGFSELLKNSSLPENKRNEYIDILQSKGNQLLRLINDIVDISKIETNNMPIYIEPVNLNHLLGELKKTYERTLVKEGKQNAISLNFKRLFNTDSSWIMTDGIRLKQILSNLLDNAIKFTQSGEIKVSYSLIENNTLQFSVKDPGIGIPSDKLSVIFDRFVQVNNNEEVSKTGTGLGLSIVKSLVELLGGKVWVISECYKGSSFYFTIPYIVASNENNAHTDLTLDISNINWQDKTILIAEDDKDNYLVLHEFLAETKLNIIWAKNGNEALEIALSGRKIDLILMDIKMPGMNGYEVTRKIKETQSHIPIIAQTAYAMEEDKKKAMAALCDGYISKPIDFNQLIISLDKYLN